jgi:hypothetical protein
MIFLKEREDTTMREVYTNFTNTSTRPELGLGLSVALGREDTHPDLATLQDGDPVLLVETGKLQAPGIAKLVERDGVRSWYGLVRQEDIQPVTPRSDLPPDIEAAFDDEFDPESPGMQYLRDR